MRPLVVSPAEPDGRDASLCGNKAAALATLGAGGMLIPRGFCITTEAYRRFISQTELRGRLVIELGRKRFEDMRWEELWDVALRIRNAFLSASIPGDIRTALENALQANLPALPVAVRSSSTVEDLPGASFAGLHESFVNVKGTGAVLDRVKLVWASLWSDAALSYHKELSLDIDGSAMAVLVQELIAGERSGIAFGVNPTDTNQAVVEAVYGLNKALVDGDVEPDRWLLDRATGRIVSVHHATRERSAVPAPGGVAFRRLEKNDAGKAPLSKSQVSRIFSILQRIEGVFGSPQDMEWTFSGRRLYVLQSRPITAGKGEVAGDRRSFDLSLKRSFENLKKLRRRIEDVLVPRMIEEAGSIARTGVSGLSDAELAGEIGTRRETLDRWNEIYWNEFIPYAHGVRLFGRIYNDRLKPDDPYEFVDLLSAAGTRSMDRNEELERLATRVRGHPELLRASPDGAGRDIGRELDRYIERFSGLSCELGKCDDERRSLAGILERMAAAPHRRPRRRNEDALLKRYLSAFTGDEKTSARELLDLARSSYRLRDDDNIYLGRFETLLVEAVEESRRRLGSRCKDEYACSNPEEAMRALKFPAYEPKGRPPERQSVIRGAEHARQLRGQPAGRGIARGPARVVVDTAGLFEVRSGEVLVVDAIDPNMTFVVPLVSAIVERRGGMLIHGAIIAREYGLPCVTGIPGATELIRTGDRLTVDGYYGTVIIDREGIKEEAGDEAGEDA